MERVRIEEFVCKVIYFIVSFCVGFRDCVWKIEVILLSGLDVLDVKS